MSKISEALQDFNPWWEEEFSMRFKQREIYQRLQKYLPTPQILAFTGLRRAGKMSL